MRKAAFLAFALLGVIWGSNFIFMKWAAEDISPSPILATAVYYFAFAKGTALLPSSIAGLLSGAMPTAGAPWSAVAL